MRLCDIVTAASARNLWVGVCFWTKTGTPLERSATVRLCHRKQKTVCAKVSGVVLQNLRGGERTSCSTIERTVADRWGIV